MLQIVNDPRWRQVAARDAAADGAFVYSVATTGVYCRPSCASRAANPKNVRFHADAAAAEAAGFRACKRCRPDEAPEARLAELVAAACRTIDAAEEAPDLATLAAAAGLSSGYFQRVFKRLTGLSPRGYVAAKRAERLRESLPGAASVTDALYDAGYGSSGRAYEAAPGALGMTPSAYRRGGAGETIEYAVDDCSLGTLLVAASGKGLCAILLGDDAGALPAELGRIFGAATLVPAGPAFALRLAEVVALIEGRAPAAGLPLDLRGTLFQQRVWAALREIPAGETLSYAELAGRMGLPKAARAVASACAANRLAVAVPCHRVVRSGGAVSGYRWGVERKKALLARERGM